MNLHCILTSHLDMISAAFWFNRILHFMICLISDTFLCLFCSKLDTSVNFKPVAAKDKIKSYHVGEEITCFVSKVSFEDCSGLSWLALVLITS